MSKITTDFLYRRSNNLQISLYVNELIKSINGAILEKHKAGYSEIGYELPENFTIQNLERADAQLIIYSRIIQHYKEAGFTVRIKLRPDPEGSHIYIKWDTTLDPEEKKRMKELISKHSI